MARATSSGDAARPLGTRLARASVLPPVTRSSIGVSVGPGATTRTRMPSFAAFHTRSAPRAQGCELPQDHS
jgi:hypothetical protein